MKYKGNNKFYIDIGIKEDPSRFYYKRFVFKLFFLCKRNDEGVSLRFWENYIGINFESRGWRYKKFIN